MDRQLTEEEKIEQRKKLVHPKRNTPESITKTYRTLIKASVLCLFLACPQLVEYGVSRFSATDQAQSLIKNNEPFIQIYTARTWGLKGMFAVHSWIVTKRKGAKSHEVSQVIGWRREGSGNVLFRETNIPYKSWWGNKATMVLDLRGDDIELIIDKVDTAIQAYPWKNEYTLFPGPNSNTFVAWIGLQVPELGLDLPSTAIGKDWRPLTNSLGSSASGTGVQASLYGLLGLSAGVEEGLEINAIGLNFELDVFDLALELPLLGRFESWYLLCYLVIWLGLRKWIKNTELKLSR